MVDKVLPKVGDKVSVTIKSDGEGRLLHSKADVGIITKVYLDGDVCVGNGDVYPIEPSSDGKVKWQTSRPRKNREA